MLPDFNLFFFLILKPPLILDTKKKTRTHALVFFLDQWMPHDLLQKIIPPDSTSGPIFLAQQLTCAVLIRFPFVSQVKFLLYSKQPFTKKCLDPCSCPINLCLQLMKSEKNLHLKIKFLQYKLFKYLDHVVYLEHEKKCYN